MIAAFPWCCGAVNRHCQKKLSFTISVYLSRTRTKRSLSEVVFVQPVRRLLLLSGWNSPHVVGKLSCMVRSFYTFFSCTEWIRWISQTFDWSICPHVRPGNCDAFPLISLLYKPYGRAFQFGISCPLCPGTQCGFIKNLVITYG